MKSNVFSTIFGISSFLIAACSSDSGSGADSINPLNPTNPSTSTCALATQYLPNSTIAYVDNESGGCVVSGQSFSVEEYAAYDAALVAAGFTKAEVIAGSSNYNKTLEDASVITVNLVYVNETQVISATVVKQEKTYLFGDIEKFGELYVRPFSSILGKFEWNYTNASLEYLSSDFIPIDVKSSMSRDEKKTMFNQMLDELESKAFELGWANIERSDANYTNGCYIQAYMVYSGYTYSIRLYGNLELENSGDYFIIELKKRT
ncbi:hypothetical protein [Fibrobacter sp. UWB1]|uniref:hypothetical protein n=1 Tax=Fibrobacter sp. UWB1 TaxID=1964355 RepID=UPI00113FE144|nr:hypothetical protein [Fibrobacter sp. UWB1]